MTFQQRNSSGFGLNLSKEQIDNIDPTRLVVSDTAMKALERMRCKNCAESVTGHIADAGLVIDYAGHKFCCVVCLENWVDEQQG